MKSLYICYALILHGFPTCNLGHEMKCQNKVKFIIIYELYVQRPKIKSRKVYSYPRKCLLLGNQRNFTHTKIYDFIIFKK